MNALNLLCIVSLAGDAGMLTIAIFAVGRDITPTDSTGTIKT